MHPVKNNSDFLPNKQWPQWLSTVCACMGMFTTGMCFGWSSPSIAILQSSSSPLPITNSEASWITSLLQFGAAIGPIPGALISKYYGLKTCILVSVVPYTIGFILIIFAESAPMLYASRVISGLAVGLSYASTPIYVSEIAENRIRGGLMTLFTLTLSAGMVFVSAVAPYVSLRTMAGIMLIFPILLTSIAFAPESPLFYVRNHEETKALKSLSRLRRQFDEKVLQSDLDSMKSNTVRNMKIVDCLKEFFTRPNLKAFGIVVLTIMNQQLSGAVTAMLYLESIYSSTNMEFPSSIAVLLTLLLMLIFSFLTIGLPDYFGRKPLLLMSAFGCIISSAMLGAFYIISGKNNDIASISVLAIVSINLLEISSAIGLLPMPYTIAGEIFSANVKEVAICTISILGSLFGFVGTKMFQVVEDNFGTATVFLGLMCITIVLSSFVFLFVPETKGKSFNEIQDLLKGSSFYVRGREISESNEQIFDPNSQNRF